MNALNVNLGPFRYLLLFVILMLVQVLICNQIFLFDVAFPIVFIYFILALPMNININLLLSLAFISGFFIDIFSDTLGLNALDCTLIAILRKPVFYVYMQKEEKYKTIEPSISSIGWVNYVKYVLTLVTIYCYIFFILEYLSIFPIKSILLTGLFSSLLSAVLIIGIDSIAKTKPEEF